MKRLMTAAVLLGSVLGVQAQMTPVGLWKTIDDDGKTEKSYVRITESNGVLSGRIEKILDPAKQGAVCDECSDERKGKPLLGMVFMRNMRQSDDKSQWEGGEVLDPTNGKTYRARMKPTEGGKKLEMRAYIGMPLLGRTQTWIRLE